MNYDKLITKIFIKETDRGPRINQSINAYFLRSKTRSWPNIKNYIDNRYKDSESTKETIFRMYFNIEERPVCPICGKSLNFNISYRDNTCFTRYCSVSCQQKDSCIYKKQHETKLKKYGSVNNSNKRRQTNLERYGVLEQSQRPDILKKQIDTKIDKYGSSNNNEKRWNAIKNDTQKYTEYCEKMSKFFSSDEFKQKQHDTKKLNNSFNSSKVEDKAFELIYNVFPDVIRQYRSEEYPYNCDFYIKSLELYIELNASWTHGGHLFDIENKKDIDKLNIWKEKSKSSKYYENAIYTWTILDVEKYNTAIKNKLNYKIFYNLDDLKIWLDISMPYDKNILHKELDLIRRSQPSISLTNSHNKIVKYYQQETLYKEEKELWNDKDIRNKLIENRTKYLKKKSFTAEELLRGFKISGLHYGYSHFNHNIMKTVYNICNTKMCYDPCGGWGHHVLGSLSIDKFIYSDLSYSTYKNVQNMITDLGIDNVVCYNRDANTFIPEDNFDTMFCCPPYYNVEIYECGKFEDMDEFNTFMSNMFKCFYTKESCKYFAMVIQESLMNTDKYVPWQIIDLKGKTSHLNNNKKNQDRERLYIFKKQHLYTPT